GEYVYDLSPVTAIELDNKPGTLAETADKIGKAGVNISYVYGSVSPADGKTLFVFCPDDIDLAVQTFQK
ncbi:MAG: amino acid-binding protein, partial [Deltaproteobacteria bacterium]